MKIMRCLRTNEVYVNTKKEEKEQKLLTININSLGN